MASYTWQQLYGSGSQGEDLVGAKTFTFSNPSGSAYFTMETVKGPNHSYGAGSIKGFNGTYAVSQSHSLVTSSYIASINVPSGNSIFTFSSGAGTVSGSSFFLRGTGMYSLTIS